MPSGSASFAVGDAQARCPFRPLWVIAACLMGVTACGGQPETAGLSYGEPDERQGPEVPPMMATATPSTETAAAPRGCIAPQGVSGSPGTLAEALLLINALPHPVTIPCLLESLDRPLQVNATNSVFSAQPAAGSRSPRVFIFSGQLVLSVVPDGAGRELLESSQLTSSTRSVKSEIAFPVERQLDMAAAFSRLPLNGGSVCALCHADEKRVSVDGTPGGFESKALKPRADGAVSVDAIRKESLNCDTKKEPERCLILTALMAHGEVQEHPFPTEMQTFF